VEMRPPSKEEILSQPPAPKQAKEKNRKGDPCSPNLKKQKPKKNQARIPKGSTIALSLDSVHRLRDESEDEEESNLVACVRAGTSIQKPSIPEEVNEGASAEVLEVESIEATLSQAEMVEREIRGEASEWLKMFRGPSLM